MTDINSLSRHAFQPTEEPNNAAGHQARIAYHTSKAYITLWKEMIV